MISLLRGGAVLGAAGRGRRPQRDRRLAPTDLDADVYAVPYGRFG